MCYGSAAPYTKCITTNHHPCMHLWGSRTRHINCRVISNTVRICIRWVRVSSSPLWDYDLPPRDKESGRDKDWDMCLCGAHDRRACGDIFARTKRTTSIVYIYLLFIWLCEEPTARHKSKLLLIVARACKLLYAAAYWCTRWQVGLCMRWAYYSYVRCSLKTHKFLYTFVYDTNMRKRSGAKQFSGDGKCFTGKLYFYI